MTESTSKRKNDDLMNKNNSFPPDLEQKMRELHNSLENVQKIVDPLTKTTSAELGEKLEPIDQARLSISNAYLLNSLYWIYLNTKCVNPQEHDIKHEMERIKNYMLRMKEIVDKVKAPKINSKAAQRFVRSALWEPKENENDKESSSTQSPSENPQKRKRLR